MSGPSELNQEGITRSDSVQGHLAKVLQAELSSSSKMWEVQHMWIRKLEVRIFTFSAGFLGNG